MLDPVTTTLVTKVWKEILDWTKPQQWVFWNYIFLNWFWWKKMSISNEVTKAEIENAYELKKLEWKVTQTQIIEALQSSDTEVDYKNLFWTLGKVLPKIKDNAEWNIDPDKMKRLKDLSKEYSSDEMQDYIAKIISWEYNKSGTYSLQTMDIIKTLSKEEIKIFQKFKWIIFEKDTLSEALFRDVKLMNRFNLNYDELLLLSSLNLIAMNSSVKWIPDIWNNILPFEYNWKVLWLKYKWKKTINNLYFLTRAWKEMYWLLDDNCNQDFLEYLKEFYKWNWVELIEQNTKK